MIRFLSEIPMTEITARRAAVRPRVTVNGKSADVTHLLEDVVREALQTHGAGLIEIAGQAGMGKTTALEHLSEVLTAAEQSNVRFHDEPGRDEIVNRTRDQVHICTRRPNQDPTETFVSLHLTGWCEDDAIEYLLARHHDQCGSVISRLNSSRENQIEYQLLVGCPETIVLLLDRMAEDETITSVNQCLRDVVSELFPEGELRKPSGEMCLYTFLQRDLPRHQTWKKLQEIPAWKQINERHRELPRKLLRHRYIQTLLAAEEVVRQISNRETCHFRKPKELPQLVAEAARLIEADSPAERNLLRMLSYRLDRVMQPLAASLLHATGRGWRCGRKPVPDLRGAILQGIQLAEENLCSFDFSGADLSGANLLDARLVRARLLNTDLEGANLSNAALGNVDADGAKLPRANLKNVTGTKSLWKEADLRWADLEGARLDNAAFNLADLSQANFTNASLCGSSFIGATIEGTVFTGADLTCATLRGLELNQCELSGACFDSADLTGCNCEGVNLPEANFRNANLTNTYWTDSLLPGANFHGVTLRGAGLAGIEWEHADLGGADLRESTFHMGSSRSGLVDSFIASEGTRTGFYTDEYEEQHYKSPEEIRKANLRGADLRGANITGVDFYLVDLRDARYDEEQRKQFEKTGAILFDRD